MNKKKATINKGIYIGLGRYKFDPIEEDPKVPEELQLGEEDLSEYRYHLLQFMGPVKAEWFQEVNHLGAEIIEYIPKFTYLVKVDPVLLPNIKSLKFIRWGGLYKPAYKISKNLKDRDGTIKNISMLIHDDGNIDQVFNQLKDQKISILNVRRLQRTKTLVFQNVIVKMNANKIPEIAKIPSVRWLEYVSPVPHHEDEVSCQIIAGNLPPTPSYNNWLDDLDINIHGSNEKIAIADTGFDTNDPATCHPDVRGRLAITDIKIYLNASNTDTKGHGTAVAGSALGNAARGTTDGNNFLYGLGVAPDANLIVLAHCYDESLSSCIQPMSAYTKDAITRGATVLNCSWGDGAGVGSGYNNNSIELDMCVRNANPDTNEMEPLIIVMSAGNEGWYEKPDYLIQNPTETYFPNWGYREESINTPKEAKNIIVVGATENFRPNNRAIVAVQGCKGVLANNHIDLAFCSSRGPAQDGRILPTVVAPGMLISSLRSNNVLNDREISADYIWMCGTSMAAPHVAGAIALICEWWKRLYGDKTPSPAMVKALLINGAVDIVGGTRGDEPYWIHPNGSWRPSPLPPPSPVFNSEDMKNIPSYDQGWGLINLSNIINNGPTFYKDQTTTFTEEGQEFTINIDPADTNLPLKITLSWSDPPAMSGANPTLINDLDLEVLEQATTNLYKGNWFPNPSVDPNQNSTGWSVSGGQKDNINNVECVYIKNPAGEYEVKIKCTELNKDGIPPYADDLNREEFRQDFALVISNAIASTGDPVDVVLTIDRTGSMKHWGYDVPAKERAKEFVDLMEMDDHISIVSFAYVLDSVVYDTNPPAHYRGEKVYTEFQLRTIDSVGTYTNAKNAIDGIWCERGPTTSIGAGLQEAQLQLTNFGSSAPDSIVLLSDGHENTDPRVDDVMPNIPPETKIYTLSLGEHSATSLLEQIANDRNGVYYHAADPLEVAECYYRIKGAVTGEGISMLEEGDIATNGDPLHTVIVDTYSKKATFAVSWMKSENKLDFELKDPNGNVINRNAPNIQFKEGSTYKFYIVSSPMPGNWELNISDENIVSSPAHYTTVAFLDSSLKVQTFLLRKQFLKTGNPIILGIRIMCDEKPIIDAQVNVNVVFLEKSVKTQLKRMSKILKNVELREDILQISSNLLNVIDESKVRSVLKEVKSMKDTIPEDLIKLKFLQKLLENKAIKLDPQLQDILKPFKPVFPSIRTQTRKLYHVGDGLYFDYFTQTDVEGPYIFRIKSEGYTEDNSWFTRNDALAVNIPLEKEMPYSGPTIQLVKLPSTQKLKEMGVPKNLADNLKKFI